MTDDQRALKLLKQYQKEVNVLLQKYFDQEKKQSKKIDSIAVKSIKSIEKFVMAGGKRLRPALLYYGYLAMGGANKKAIKQASLSIELIHDFLLIHDDIMDRDDTRHGIDTIHREYEKVCQKYFPDKNKKHYGQSMGIVIGDLCYTLGNKVLFKSSFSPDIILQALVKLQNIVYEVIPGQIRDVTLGFKGEATEKEILKVQEAKTAYYTFDGPIALGCILAENKDKEAEKYFTKYSLAMGKAFQIRDDILGIFGDEKTIGKPVGSDIIEGKRTLLTNFVIKNGTRTEIKKMEKLLGKENLNNKELEGFRKIIKESGSLKYSQEKGNGMVTKALKNLEKIDFKNKEAEVFFRGIAKYIVSREV